MTEPANKTLPILEPPPPSSSYPSSKVTSAGITGAISVLVIWILVAGFHIAVPPEIASSITVLVSFIAGYITPHRPG